MTYLSRDYDMSQQSLTFGKELANPKLSTGGSTFVGLEGMSLRRVYNHSQMQSNCLGRQEQTAVAKPNGSMFLRHTITGVGERGREPKKKGLDTASKPKPGPYLGSLPSP